MEKGGEELGSLKDDGGVIRLYLCRLGIVVIKGKVR